MNWQVMDDYGQPYGPPVLAPRTNGMAIAALAECQPRAFGGHLMVGERCWGRFG